MLLARIGGSLRALVIAMVALFAIAIGVLAPVATVAAAVGDIPVLVSAASRKVHGAAGTFDLALALTPANPTTEPRQGPAHTIVFIFDKPVTSGSAVVTEGTATVGAITFNGSEMIVPLTGVTNLQYLTVAVTNVAAADGGTGGSGSVTIGYLAGDVSQNRVVTLSDLGQVNAQVSQFVTASNFLKDVNASGTLSLADKGITNAQVTKALAAVPEGAPSVLSTVPAHNATNISRNATVTIQFSEPVTVSGNWFQMACTSGLRTPSDTTATGNSSLNTGTTFTLNPNVEFAFGDVCAVTIFAAAVSDLDSSDPPDLMAADFAFTFTVSATNIPPTVHNDSGFTAPGAGVQINVLGNDSDPDQDLLSIVSFGQGANGGVACLPNGNCTYTPNPGFIGVDTFDYTAGDGQGGTQSATVSITVSATDPTINAPPLDLSLPTTVDQAAAFLYTGTNPVQTGVAPGTIQATRVSILRGKVMTRDGNPLPGAIVTILGNSQFGQTVSRANGAYDMAVNGARQLTVNIAASGFLPAHRQVQVPWQGFVDVPDVALVALDTQVTAIAANAGAIQVHRASTVTDADGSRKATLLFPAGTTATMVLPNGSTQPLSTLNVRATEYTVGPNGPMAMAAMLPPTSAYTYAVELSADQAIAAGATMVTFNQPVPTYVENFLNFPVGTLVPSGYYDRVKAQWLPLPNGRVIKILGITGNLADLDVTGDGVADSGSTLTSLGITAAEQQQLAALYAPGQSLWRSPVSHFSFVDQNWPFDLPDDAVGPGENGAGAEPETPEQESCQASGSIVECENQVLGERIAIVGTPYSLNYRSDRVPGRQSILNLKLSGPSVPASLQGIRVRATIGGQTQTASFPAAPDQTHVLFGNHQDVYGRPVQGGQVASATIEYSYQGVYADVAGFPLNRFGDYGAGVTAVNVRSSAGQIGLAQTFNAVVGEGVTDARAFGLGGWMLDVHHFYDFNGRVLHTGDGGRRRAKALGNPITTIGGTGVAGITGNGTLATQATVDPVGGMAIGPDGTVYFCNYSAGALQSSLVRRIFPGGFITTVAGSTGAFGFNGDNILAINAHLACDDIAVGPDFSVYIADIPNRRVRRIRPNNTITTVAGDGTTTQGVEGVDATQTSVRPHRIALGPEGNLYIGELVSAGQLTRIRRVGPDGIISTLVSCIASNCGVDGLAVGPDGSVYYTDRPNGPATRIKRKLPSGATLIVAGSGTCQSGVDGIVNALPAVEANLCQVNNLAVGPDGTTYFSDANSPALASVGVDGMLGIVAGKANGTLADGVLARDATLHTLDVKIGPDAAIYLSTRNQAPGPANARIRRISASLPGFTNAAFIVAAKSGQEVYSFDAQGRHLNTRHALTNAILREFAYDSAGRLAQVTEKTGVTDNVTTIQHGATGDPTSIMAPFGQSTTLTVDANRFLASITNPAGESFQLASTSGGLLTSLTDPRGKTSILTYYTDGRLKRDTDAAGGFQNLARTATSGQFTVARTTALSRTTTYKIEELPGRIHKRTVTAPDGTQAVSEESIDSGTITATAPDGTVTSLQLGADPRFAMQSPIASSLSIALPSGPTFTAASTQTAVLSQPLDPLSLTGLTGTSTVDGRTTTNIYTASTKTEVTTTPGGRTGTLTIDALGRPVQMQTGGLAPAALTYDGRGRLASMTRGSGPSARTFVLAYNPQGFLATITDPIGRIVQFTYDAAGRVISKTLPDGRVAAFGYDAAGNVTSVTPPGRPAHTFAYSDRGELTLETPPALAGTGPTSLSYNLDSQYVTSTWPDNRSVTRGYDAAGRRTSSIFATAGVTTGTDTLSYDSAGRVASAGAASGVTSAYTYSGALQTGETWSGATAGSVTVSYDASLRLASESVNGANTIAIGYDDDSLLITAGELAVARDPQHGLPTGSTLGIVSTTTGYSSFGEADSHAASANASTLYNVSYIRDGLGRISQKTETIGGVTDTYVYSYDAVGQVTAVAKNGTTAESYGYDTNGNRVSATVSGVSTTAAYDAQDRLSAYGTTSYAYNAAGELLSKTASGQTTSYQYDALGNLLGVTLPSGTSISYVVDGLERRVGKRVNATPVQGLLYGDALRPVAELNGAGTVVSRFVYAGNSVPAYMIKGGVAHRIIADQIGSVRLVVNATTGVIVQRIDYDTFGNVILDSNPGFQPFGFAGGIYDTDSGLVRFGARDYDSSIGRWTAKDPIGFEGGDTGLYRYARNDPVNLVDPSGLNTLDTVAGAFDQLNENLLLGNPVVALSVLLETVLVAGFEWAGFDPGPRYVTHHWRDIVRPPPPAFVDSMSADYTKGELIIQCADIATAAVGGVTRGIGAGIAALERRLARSAALATEKAAADLAKIAARKSRQAAHDYLARGVEAAKGQGGGSGGANPLGRKGSRN